METNEPKEKRLKLSTLESKYGTQKLTVIDDSIRKQVLEEMEAIESESSKDPFLTKNETYRLFGVSSFSTKRKNLLCLRFDTCFHGHYFEIYYIFVKLLKKDKVVPKIVAHTLPSFLPLDEWERECLSTDLPTFTQCVSLHLNSFIARREQCKAVQAAYPSLELTASMGYTHVSIAFEHFRLQLGYSADSRRPHSVEQTVSEAVESFPRAAREQISLLSQHKSDFEHRDLLEVLSDWILLRVFSPTH